MVTKQKRYQNKLYSQKRLRNTRYTIQRSRLGTRRQVKIIAKFVTPLELRYRNIFSCPTDLSKSLGKSLL